MAVDPDQIHDISIATVQLWRDAELRLTELIASFLREGIDAPTWATERLAALGDLRRAAGDVLGQLETEGLPLLRDNVAEAYRTGFGAALTDLPDPFLARVAQAATATIPRLAAMESLSAALIVDIGQRHNNVLRHVIDVYRATIAQASALSIAGGVTRRRASQDAYARFIDQGVSSFTDVAGRRWRLSSYVEMATRTVTQRAAVQGRTDRLQSIGVNLVVVSDSPRECKRCRPWESQILSLDGTVGTVTLSSVTTGEPVTVEVEASLDQARATGLFHPNCTHSVSGYLPGATRVTPAQANPEGDQAQQRQREIERHIRGWKERGKGAIDPKAQAEAGKRQRAWEQEMREHLKANPELKRLPYREEVGAGNRPPPGLRGGGPSGSPLPTPPPGPSRQGPPARRGPDARTGPLARRGPSAQRGPDAQSGPGAMRTPPRAGAAASANMTVPELRALARERGIRGYSTMRKQELLDAVNGAPVRVPPPARKTPAKRPAPAKKAPAPRKAPAPKPLPTPERMTGPALRKELEAAGVDLPAKVGKPELQRWVAAVRSDRDAALTQIRREVAKASGRPSSVAPSLRDIIDAPGGITTVMARQQTVADAVEGTYGRFRVHASSTVRPGREVTITGYVEDAQGRIVGRFDRSITVDPDTGELIARHGRLELDRSVQGSGLAEALNGNLIDWYRRSGVTHIDLIANIDVGGYAWASKGFDFADASAARSFLGSATIKVRSALLRFERSGRLPKGITEEDLRALASYVHAMAAGRVIASAPDIARFGRKPGQGGKKAIWPGKWLMLGSSWDARLPL